MRMFKRVGALVAVTGLVFLGVGGTSASATPPTPEHQDYVCKYVGKPGVDERLQTGQNPVFVDTAATTTGSVNDLFRDAQRSYVIVADTLKLNPEPTIADCPSGDVPLKPNPESEVVSSDAVDCVAKKVTTTSVRTSTDYKLVDNVWVEVVTVTPLPPTTRDATPQECAGPGKPKTETVVVSSDAVDCVAKKVTTTSVSTTTDWKFENNAWVKVVTVTQLPPTTRDATPQECTRVLVKPSPEIVVTSSDAVNCPADEVSTTTVTKTTGWKLEDSKWVKDSTVTTQNVTTRDATQAECPVEVLGVGGVAPAVTPPAVASAGNPLPSAAAAGDADTSGQLAVGSLTGLAALMMLGAGFLLRRRHGEA